jgi:hypothetical protein
MPVIVLDAQNKVSYFSILEVRTYSWIKTNQQK